MGRERETEERDGGEQCRFVNCFAASVSLSLCLLLAAAFGASVLDGALSA